MDWRNALVPAVALGALLSLAGRGGLPLGPEMKLGGPATVSGRVVEAGSGQPVAGAAIEVEGAGALQSVRSGPDGRFDLRVVWERGEEAAPGQAVLKARVAAAGYRDLELELDLTPGSLQRDFALAPDDR